MTLKNNLREIYRALSSPTAGPSTLVADPSGTHIYGHKSHLGRLWSSYYGIKRLLNDRNSQLKNVQRAILHTQQALNIEFSKVVPYLDHYQEYLRKKSKQYAVDEDNYFTDRRRITKWNADTGPFIRILCPQVKALLSEYLPVDHVRDSSRSFLPKRIEELQACQKIIDLEGITQGPLPIEIFKKILKGKQLSTAENKEIHRWIVVLNKMDPDIGQVHQALEALSKQFKKKEASEADRKSSLNRLELYLEENGCRRLFQKQDPTCASRLNRLASGATIAISNEVVVLDEEIHGIKFANDHTHVYSLKEQPDKVVVFAHNGIILPLREAQMRKDHCAGFKPVHFLDISQDGSVALMERLQPIGTVKWTSLMGHLSSQDAPFANELAKFLGLLIKLNQTPSYLSPSYFMLDSECCLRVIRPITQQPFDFNRIEDFIMECSAGNLTIYQYLMTTSGLAKHPIAIFYTKLVTESLKGSEISPDDLAGIFKIADHKVVDRAKTLIQQIQALKKQLYASLRKTIKTDDSALVDRQINQAVLDCRHAHKSAGVLWATLAQEVMEKGFC